MLTLAFNPGKDKWISVSLRLTGLHSETWSQEKKKENKTLVCHGQLVVFLNTPVLPGAVSTEHVRKHPAQPKLHPG